MIGLSELHMHDAREHFLQPLPALASERKEKQKQVSWHQPVPRTSRKIINIHGFHGKQSSTLLVEANG